MREAGEGGGKQPCARAIKRGREVCICLYEGRSPPGHREKAQPFFFPQQGYFLLLTHACTHRLNRPPAPTLTSFFLFKDIGGESNLGSEERGLCTSEGKYAEGKVVQMRLKLQWRWRASTAGDIEAARVVKVIL